jgi:hypothetical protein
MIIFPRDIASSLLAVLPAWLASIPKRRRSSFDGPSIQVNEAEGRRSIIILLFINFTADDGEESLSCTACNPRS